MKNQDTSDGVDIVIFGSSTMDYDRRKDILQIIWLSFSDIKLLQAMFLLLLRLWATENILLMEDTFISS